MTTIARICLLMLLFQVFLAAGCARKTPPPQPATAMSPAYEDAQELKLKIRELADQMLATVPNHALQGLVAMPTSFVDLDNKARTSSLGNLFAESLIYEFNQRGFPVREYRLTGNIDVVLGQGDFALLRKGLVSTVNQKWAALIVGTYYRTPDAVFVNARLVRANDGMVLRTGQLVLVNNTLVASMSAPLPKPVTDKPGGVMTSGGLTLVPAPWATPPASSRRSSKSSSSKSSAKGIRGTPIAQ